MNCESANGQPLDEAIMNRPEGNENHADVSQFLITEYSSLQFARSQTIAESNGRLSSYLTVLSATIVSLAFVAQVSGNSEILVYFVLLVVPVTIFLGITTLARIIQLGVAEVVYVRGMNRIRHYFRENTPGVAPYLVLSIFDDQKGIRKSMFISSGFSENFLGAPVIIAVINSILAAVSGGMMSSLFTKVGEYGIYIGGLLFIIALFLHAAFGRKFALRTFEYASGLSDVRFPSP